MPAPTWVLSWLYSSHPAQPNVAAALQELRAVCAFFKLLGTYPVDTH